MRPRDKSAPRHRRPRHSLGRPAAVVFLVAALGVCVTAGVLVGARPGPDRVDARAEREEMSLAGGVALPEGTDVRAAQEDLERPLLPRAGSRRGAAGTPAASPAPAASSDTAAVLPAQGPVVRAAAVLRGWDERRARVWAEGDVRALRDLYVDGVGAADVRLLRRYTDRGYRVEGMTTQLLAVDVLERAPDRWRLRVTDRLASAFAVRGQERVRLPPDREGTHAVTLVREEDGSWRVAQVRAAAGSR